MIETNFRRVCKAFVIMLKCSWANQTKQTIQKVKIRQMIRNQQLQLERKTRRRLDRLLSLNQRHQARTRSQKNSLYRRSLHPRTILIYQKKVAKILMAQTRIRLMNRSHNSHHFWHNLLQLEVAYSLDRIHSRI